MAEPQVPMAWTAQYVAENRRKCLSFLQAANLLVVRHMEKRRYASAVASLDQLLGGLEVMHNSGQFGDLRLHMSFLSFSEGLIMAFANPDAMMREAAELGRATKYTPEQMQNNGLAIAAGLLVDARDFARTDEMKQSLDPLLAVLEQGDAAVQQLRDEEFPNYPEELLERYRDFNIRLFDPLIERGTSPIPLPPPGRHGRTGVRAEMAREKKKKPPKQKAYPPDGFKGFGDWTFANGWDEEALAKVYRRVKIRKNLYAVLACTPLVIFFLPFYAKASDLAEIIRTRNLKAEGRTSNLTALLIGFCILGWLLVPPLLAGLFFGIIIEVTEWGTGLGERLPRPQGWTGNALPFPAPAVAPSRSSGGLLAKIALAVIFGLILAGLIFLLAPGLGSFGEDLMSPLFSPLFIDRLPRLLLY